MPDAIQTDFDLLVAEALDRLRTGVADTAVDVVAQLAEEGLAHPPLEEPLRMQLAAEGYA